MKIADQGKNILIGALMIAACAIMVWTLIFLNPTVGDAGKILRIRFANIDKVSVGTRVAYAGKPIGKVIEINAVDSPRTLDRPGPVYAFELVLAIDSSVNVFKTDQFAVHTSGLLGERSVVIIPRRVKPGQSLEEVAEDEVMYASPVGSVEETFSGLSSLAKKVESVLGQLSELLEVNGEDITLAIGAIKGGFEKFETLLQQMDDAKVVPSMCDSFNGIATAMKKLEEEHLLEHLTTLAKNMEEITTAFNQSDKIDSLISNSASVASRFAAVSENIMNDWPKIHSSLDDLASSATMIKEMTSSMSQSKGTAGKLLFDEGLYLQMRLTMSKAETLMDDINHYGLLFHLDKGWQRQRTRRMNVLSELSTPGQFRDFFEQEMAQVNTSLARVSQALERAEEGPNSKELQSNKEFTKAYSELMRRVETLAETLQMYNQQVNTNGSPG